MNGIFVILLARIHESRSAKHRPIFLGPRIVDLYSEPRQISKLPRLLLPSHSTSKLVSEIETRDKHAKPSSGSFRLPAELRNVSYEVNKYEMFMYNTRYPAGDPAHISFLASIYSIRSPVPHIVATLETLHGHRLLPLLRTPRMRPTSTSPPFVFASLWLLLRLASLLHRSCQSGKQTTTIPVQALRS